MNEQSVNLLIATFWRELKALKAFQPADDVSVPLNEQPFEWSGTLAAAPNPSVPGTATATIDIGPTIAGTISNYAISVVVDDQPNYSFAPIINFSEAGVFWTTSLTDGVLTITLRNTDDFTKQATINVVKFSKG